VQGWLENPGTYRIQEIKQQLQDCMSEYCGVFRSEATMAQGIEKLQQIQQNIDRVYLDDKGKLWNTEIIEALELQNLAVVSQVILHSALHRRESRGAHYREDYPFRDDTRFLQHTLGYYFPAGVDVKYQPVTIKQFQPEERTY
jgi:succinate dehydrogenase / fumarate reductase flavoprotein subunit